MKVLHIISSLGRGGKERQLYELIKGMKGSVEQSLIVFCKDLAYPVASLGFPVLSISKDQRKRINLFMTVVLQIREFKPDIVHCWDTLSYTYALAGRLFSSYRIIDGSIRYAGKIDSNFPKRMMKKLRFHFADQIIANSEAGLRVEGLLGSWKARVIHNGFDLARFNEDPGFSAQAAGLDERTIKIVMVAGFRPAKDHATLIKAASILCNRRDNLQFILVGGGINQLNIQQSVPQAIRDKVLFPGERSDVEQILLHCDIGILLNNTRGHAEGLSNSIMEYMAAGLPVVATNAGGTTELVINGETGFLVKSFDVQAVVDKLNLLIENQARRIELGKAGRQRIEREFSLKQMTGRYLAVYSDLSQER